MNTPAAGAYRSPFSRTRQLAAVAVLSLTGMTSSFMQTLVIPIQNEFPRLLNTSVETASWVITATLLMSVITMPVAGRLGDMFGKKTVMIVVLLMLCIGSVVCSVAPGATEMIIGRALQGIGIGVVPLSISIVRDIVSDDILQGSIAVVSATLGVGAALGLPVGALIIMNTDWQTLFVLAAMAGILCILAVIFVVPKADELPGGTVDVVGVIGFAIGLTSLLVVVSQGSMWGWRSAPVIVFTAIGVLTLILWALYEWRAPNPIIDLRLNANRTLFTTNLAGIALGFALFTINIGFPYALNLPVTSGGLGLGFLATSFIIMPSGVTMLLASLIINKLPRRLEPRVFLILGAISTAIAYLVCLVLPLQIWSLTAASTVLGLGIGLAYAGMPSLIMSVVPRSATGSANGINTLMRSIGLTLASAICGAIIASSDLTNILPAVNSIFLLGFSAAAIAAIISCFIPPPHRRVEQ